MSALEDTQDRPIQSQVDDDADPELAEFERLKKEVIEAERSRGDWRKEAEMCYDYVAGHQWSSEDKAKLDEENRPAIVFNRTAPLVKAVCGLEVNNRQSVIFLPRQMGDTGVNELITSAGKWIRQECHAEDEESIAFRDCTICGEGWTEMRMDYDEDPQGKIVQERIDPLEMGVNKGANRANYIDARMIYRVRRDMDPEDVRALLGLPDELEDAAMDASKWLETSASPSDGGQGNKKDYPRETPARVRGRGGKSNPKTVTVVQCQYWRREPINMVATDDDDQVLELSNEEFEIFQQRADAAGMTYHHAQSMRKVYYECFIGIKILDRRPMELGRFQFQAMTGERDRKKKCFYGMVRDMIDPQMWSNKWLAQTIHIMNRNAKGGLIAETDAFKNVAAAERDWADPTKIVWVKPGSLAKKKVQERTPAPLPAGLDQLMMFAISSIRDVTGINLELLGQADREQAASLEQQRRQSAMTILATMFDSLRKYRKHNGKLMLQFIKLLPEGTLVRIVEQGQIKYIPLVKENLDLDKFDVIIDEAPTSPDQKQFIWAITAQILQMNILPPPAIIELLKYSPYPESVVQEIRTALGLDGELPPDQLKQRLQQAEEALQMLEGQLQEATEKAKTAEDKKEVEMLKIQVDAYRAETDRLSEQWKARIDEATAIVDAASAQVPGEAPQQAAPRIQPDGSVALLNEKVDQLAGMVGQLVQMLTPQQQMEPPPPFVEPPAEPMA